MYFSDVREIYFVSPLEILENLKKAMIRVRLEFRVTDTSEGWIIDGSDGLNRATIKLSYIRENVFKSSRAFDEIFISTIKSEIHGSPQFIERFRNALEISLLRCLG